MGKSRTLRTFESQLRRDAPRDLFITRLLGEYGSIDDLSHDIVDSPEFSSWKTGTRTLHLLLDSLDEALIGVNNVVGLLKRRLRTLPSERLRLRITCRPTAWPETLGSFLESLFGEQNFAIFSLVPLLRRQVATSAHTHHIDEDEFLAHITRLDAQPLASNPLTLELLLALYAETSTLPSRRADIYEHGLRTLCRSSDERQDHRTAGALPL